MAKAWHLKSRPQGEPTADNFELKDIDLPPLGDAMIHVRNRWLSVDPYMRGRMNDVKSYIPPFQLGEPMEGGAVGEVVESKADGFAPGDLVLHMAGWRDEAVIPAKTSKKLPDLGAEPQQFLGVLGTTGATAYFGLLDAASAKEEDIVFVSAAAGAVGSIVVQIAKAKGMIVIGSAGGKDKCDYVRSLGADAVVDYRAGPILKTLAAAAPKGIDVYFDNVGGDILEACLFQMNNRGRIACCGAISQYDGVPAAHGPRGVPGLIVVKRLIMQGFIVMDYMDQSAAALADLQSWVASGRLKVQEDVIDGIENTPKALIGLLAGENRGKRMVKV